MNSITAVVITRNEQDNIVRCLKSLSFCDAVLVIDSESTDSTVELARSLNAKVLVQPWTNFCDQRNRALRHVETEWVLSIDADEEVSEKLRVEILKLKDSVTRYSAFSLPRKTFHFGRWIRYGGWYPNRLIRLFRPRDGEWRGDELHEFWQARGEVGRLEGDLLHYSFRNLADQVDRNNRYSSLGALKLHREKKRFSLYRLTVKSTFKFFETYVLKLGFLDGYPGFIISVSAAYSVFLKWAKLWELELADEKKT